RNRLVLLGQGLRNQSDRFRLDGDGQEVDIRKTELAGEGLGNRRLRGEFELNQDLAEAFTAALSLLKRFFELIRSDQPGFAKNIAETFLLLWRSWNFFFHIAFKKLTVKNGLPKSTKKLRVVKKRPF